jgi:hypothetical protein
MLILETSTKCKSYYGQQRVDGLSVLNARASCEIHWCCTLADIAQQRFKGRALLTLELHDMRRSSRTDERPTDKAIKVIRARRTLIIEICRDMFPRC